MTKTAHCRWCGEIFTMVHNYHYYCSPACRKADQKRRDQEARKPKEKPYKVVELPTISEMQRIANELTRTNGKPVSYGKVQEMIRTGKIKVKKGKVVS